MKNPIDSTNRNEVKKRLKEEKLNTLGNDKNKLKD